MAIMTRIAPPIARIAGTPASIRLTTVRPAKTTMMPWAKLKTPEALKISTKPRAIREYITPALRPWMTIWISLSGRSPKAMKGSMKSPPKNPMTAAMMSGDVASISALAPPPFPPP